jgi:hypothetical protein
VLVSASVEQHGKRLLVGEQAHKPAPGATTVTVDIQLKTPGRAR